MKKMEASLHCWWGCKLIQPLWKMVWRCFKNHENNFTFLRHDVEQKDHWCGVGTPGSSFQPCHLILVKTQTPPDFICFIWKWEDHLRGQTCLSYYHVKRHSFKKKKKSPLWESGGHNENCGARALGLLGRFWQSPLGRLPHMVYC